MIILKDTVELETKITQRISELEKRITNIDTNKLRTKSLKKDLKECQQSKNPINIKYLVVTFNNCICMQLKDRAKAIHNIIYLI
jgi:hypothetical protein